MDLHTILQALSPSPFNGKVRHQIIVVDYLLFLDFLHQKKASIERVSPLKESLHDKLSWRNVTIQRPTMTESLKGLLHENESPMSGNKPPEPPNGP